MAKIQYQGTGRRKSSVARVRLIPGTGKITVNKRDLDNYFGTEIVKREVRRPFEVAGCEGKYDVIANVYGGGFTGQAGALRHGISRALCVADKEAYRAPLKAAGFLTRDPRMKERKKYGKKERNTVSKKQEEQASSQRDNLVFQGTLYDSKLPGNTSRGGAFVYKPIVSSPILHL